MRRSTLCNLVVLGSLFLCAADLEAGLFGRRLLGRRLIGPPPVASGHDCAACALPQDEVLEAQAPEQVLENFGVVLEKLPAAPATSLDGQEITREQAIEILQSGLPDDKNKLRLSVFGGSKEQREQIAHDVAASPLREKVVYYSAAADHFSVNDSKTGRPMFAAGPTQPTLYLQLPSGKVLHRQEGYRGASDFEAIRKAVDAYDPKRDPDLRKQDAVASLPKEFVAGGGGLGALLLLLLAQRKQP